MKLNGVVWLRNVVDKLAWKHNITINEVEEALKAATRFRFIEKGDVEGEPLYAAVGRTEAGRFLLVFFVRKTSGEALIISARDATKKERRIYGKG
jgi:hypothetical protein